MRPQHVRTTRDPTVVWYLFSKEPCGYPHNFIQLPETRVHELHYSCYSINLSVFAVFYATFSKSKKWCSRQLCNRVRIGRSRSSKIIDFGTNGKGVCDFVLVIVPFLRYGDLLAENCEFFLPHSHLTPSLGVNPFEFLNELFLAKTRVLALSVGEDFVILACVVLIQCQRVTSRRTDRQTDGQRDRNKDRSLHSKLCWCPVKTVWYFASCLLRHVRLISKVLFGRVGVG